jgi:2-polyprenyl-6-methoxyphenol hydroxylase-like FAD-dependent oxidoreductase
MLEAEKEGVSVKTDFDVVILGYGPVGHVAAALLGRAGHRVGVFDRQLSLYPLPRIGHLDHEVMRIIQAVGVAASFERDAFVCTTYDWVNAAGDVLIHFDWSRPEITGWHPHYLFYQPDLDELLSAAVETQASVQVCRGWEANVITQDAESVSLHLTHRELEEVRHVTASYLIGADGANSFVRKHTGMSWTDLGFHADWLVVDYRPNDPDADIDMPPAAQLCDPKRPVSLFRRIGHKHCRWEFMLLPGETREDIERPERIWELLSRWVKPTDGILVRHAVYTFRSGLAEQWRRDRVFLVGDAAHLMPPFLGQGMGSGLRDVLNLAWKLDLVLFGNADETLLDSYAEERKPHVRAIIDQAVELGKVVCTSDPVAAAARDAALLSGDVPPPPPFPTLIGRIFHHDERNVLGYLAGQLGPQGYVEWRGRSGRFDDVVGRGWCIMTFEAELSNQIGTRYRSVLQRLGIRVVQFGLHSLDSNVVLDSAIVYHTYFNQNGLVALIMRPDFHVFGAARANDEVWTMLTALDGLC